MPDGKTHALATAIAAGVISPLIVQSFHQPTIHGVAFAAGCLAGLVMNPDLDVQTGSRGISIMRQTGGSLVARMWRIFWYPYARWLIPHHRHPLSHLPVLGTALRLAYLCLVPALAWAAFALFLPLPPLPSLTLTLNLQWAIAGLVMVDALHALMDWTWRS